MGTEEQSPAQSRAMVIAVPLLDRPDAAKLLRDLAGLVQANAPYELPATSSAFDIVAATLLMRAAQLAESVALLFEQSHDSSALILRRSLADDLIQFAWLIANPTRATDWLSHSILKSVTASERAHALGVPPDFVPFDLEECTEYRASVASPRGLPNTLQKAQQADQYWDGKLPFEPPFSKPFESMYYLRFADDSEHTHASVSSLWRGVGEDKDSGAISVGLASLSSPAEMAATVGLFITYLVIAAEAKVVPWLDADEVYELRRTAHFEASLRMMAKVFQSLNEAPEEQRS
jgi:hypothetical protein